MERGTGEIERGKQIAEEGVGGERNTGMGRRIEEDMEWGEREKLARQIGGGGVKQGRIGEEGEVEFGKILT